MYSSFGVVCVYEVVDTRQEVSESSPLCVECFYVQRLKTSVLYNLCCQSEKELPTVRNVVYAPY